MLLESKNEKTHLLEHAGTLRNLLDDILVKHCLSENRQRAMLGLDAEFLGFEVNVNVIDLSDPSSFSRAVSRIQLPS